MNNEITELKKNIFKRAQVFIEDMGLFAPFGAKIYQNKVVDFMAYEDFEDTIKGTVLIDMMKGSIIEEFQNGKVDAGAIAYDVVINVDNEDGVQVKRDALCLIYSVDGRNWIDEYYPYIIVDSQCIWA